MGSDLRQLPSPTWALVLLVVAVFGLYANTLSNGYHLDDFYRIANNPEIRYVGNPFRHFVDPTTSATLPTIVQYRPMLPLTLSLGRALLEPLGVSALAADHLGNIALHAAICVLLFAWARRVFSEVEAAEPTRMAGWTAAVYAAHPVAGVPVNYLCARDLLLMQTFALGALVAWGRFRDPRSASGPQIAWRWALVAGACLGLAMCSKQNAAVLPLVVLGYEVLVRRRSLSEGETWWGPAGALTIVVTFFVIVERVVGFSDMDQLHFSRPPLEYPATMARIHWSYYLRNALWPFAMRPLPDLRPAASIFEWPTLLGGVAILGTLALAWRSRRRAPLVAFAIWSYWVMFAVTASVRPFRFIAMDYRQVPSLPYLIMLGVWAAWRWVPMRARAGVLGVWMAYFAVSTVGINLTWKDEASLWGNAVRLGTRAQGRVNYALSQRRGAPEVARAHLLRSLDDGENNIFSLINLGLVELDLGKNAAGIATIRKATQVAPGRSITHYWYAQGLQKLEREGEAIEAARKAAELEPGNTRYSTYAAKLLLAAGRLDEAEAVLDAATRSDADMRRVREQIAARRAR